MASPILLSKRELARAWQIVRILTRYGLLPLAQLLAQASGLGWVLRIGIGRRIERRVQEMPLPVRLRLILTELGTTFIKLGQVLSARSDLLPQEYLTELARLQDEVPPLPFDRIEPVFRAAFSVSPFDAFVDFDPMPFASASIGQVYRARLIDNTEVVVKIQRPQVAEQVKTDLDLLRRVADIGHRYAWLARYDLPSLVREFSAILQDELLYPLEAHNAETLATEMVDHPNILFPAVIWTFTARQVLTTRWIEGMKITDLEALDRAGVDRALVARTLANSLLEQILLYGMFHGDPHPGNLLVTSDGTLVFLDTGMVGRLDRKTRELLIELAVSIFDQDIDAILGHLQQLGVVGDVSDLASLRRDLSHLITKYYFLPRRELRLGELLQRMNSLLFEHNIRMAYEFGLMAKALFLAEGIAQYLDPHFDYNQAALPVIEEIRKRYYSPQTFLEDSVREWRGLRRQVVDLPRRLSAALTHFERGVFTMRLYDEVWQERETEQSTRYARLALTVLVAALLVTFTQFLSTHPTGWVYYLAVGGLAVDGVVLIALLLALWRAARL